MSGADAEDEDVQFEERSAIAFTAEANAGRAAGEDRAVQRPQFRDGRRVLDDLCPPSGSAASAVPVGPLAAVVDDVDDKGRSSAALPSRPALKVAKQG